MGIAENNMRMKFVICLLNVVYKKELIFDSLAY